MKDFTLTLISTFSKFSHELLDLNYGVEPAEVLFQKVLELIQKSPEIKADIIDVIRNDLVVRPYRDNGGDSFFPYELILFLTHALRWNELESLARDRIIKYFGASLENARGDISSDVLDALQDDWEDAEYYEYFRRHDKSDLH